MSLLNAQSQFGAQSMTTMTFGGYDRGNCEAQYAEHPDVQIVFVMHSTEMPKHITLFNR